MTEQNLHPAVRLTQELIKIPSITAIDPADFEHSVAALDVLERLGESLSAKCVRKTFSGGHDKWPYPVDNLYLELTFGKPTYHLCYMGHVDVVPVGEAEAWSHSPFSGEIIDGYLHGRGTTDMKGSVAAFAAALVQAHQTLDDSANLKISMLITADEEWAAVNGSQKMLAWLKDEGITPDAFLVGEPSSQDTLGTHLKIGRRGSLCGFLTVEGTQGHAAYTSQFKNPNRALALASALLSSYPWMDGDENYPSTNFEVVSIHSGDFNASAVIPNEAKALWNIRYTPDYTAESLEQLLLSRLENPPEWVKQHPDYALLADVRLTANLSTASIPYKSEMAQLTQAVSQAAEATLGKAPLMDASGGTTDGRFVHLFFPEAEVIEFGPPERGGYDETTPPSDYLKRGGMHQIDERILVKDLENLSQVYAETLQQLAKMEAQKNVCKVA